MKKPYMWNVLWLLYGKHINMFPYGKSNNVLCIVVGMSQSLYPLNMRLKSSL